MNINWLKRSKKGADTPRELDRSEEGLAVPEAVSDALDSSTPHDDFLNESTDTDLMHQSREKEEAKPVKAGLASRLAGRFKRGAKESSSDDNGQDTGVSSGAGRGLMNIIVGAKNAGLPIRVVIGFLPEVTPRDALEYAMGIAEKHFQQLGIVHYGTFEYENGYAFEVHEGGEGKAYLPSIMAHFRSTGPYQDDVNISAVLDTGTRKIEVLRIREGLTCLVLPEDSTTPASPWLTTSKPLTPAVPRMRGLFVAGAVVFASGLLAMTSTAVFFRLQGYLPATPQQIEMVTTSELPRGQWPRLEAAVKNNEGVKALRFKGDKWEDLELWPAPGAELAEKPASDNKKAGGPDLDPLTPAVNLIHPPALPAVNLIKQP
jgi:hypothetical protein